MKTPVFRWPRAAGAATAAGRIQSGWLPSGSGFIGASWFAGSASEARRAAVLIVPGIAHEERTMIDGLAALARSLAAAGFGSLLIDLHGTAQSSGRLDDADIGERWHQNIRSAVGHLKTAGFESVIVVGVRIGALLAQTALLDVGIAGFVAWAPVKSGRRYVRELKMLTASAAGGRADDSGPPDAGRAPGGVSIAGHDIPKAVLSCLKSHSFESCPDAGLLPMLVLDQVDPVDREPMPPTGRPTVALQAGIRQRRATQLQRWLCSPDDAPIIPTRDIRTVVDWCCERDPVVADALHSRRPQPALLTEISLACDGLAVRERTVRIGATGLSGVISEPLDRPSTGAARLLATLVGPGRMFPEMARAEAVAGKASLRFDFAGFSTSGRRADGSGGELYSSRNREDVAEAVKYLLQSGHDTVSMVGFCAGGWSMLHAGPLPGVSGIVGINVALYRQPDYRLGDVALRRGHPVAKALSLLRSVAALAKAVERIERRLPLALETGRWLRRLGGPAPRPLLVYSTDDPGLHHLDHRLPDAASASVGGRPGRSLRAAARVSIGRHAGLGHLLEGSPARARALQTIGSYLADVDVRHAATPHRAKTSVLSTRPSRQRNGAAPADSAHWEGLTWAHSR